jgi:hypothetical protein
MKALLFASLLFPFALFSQTSSLNKLVSLSPADSNRTHAMVSGQAFELMSYAEIDTFFTEAAKNLAKNIRGMEGYMDLSKNTVEKLLKKLSTASEFEPYASMDSKNQRFAIFVNQKDGVVNEVIMAAVVGNKSLAVSIYGEMDMRSLGELYKLVPFSQFKRTEQNKDEKN